jgi:nucleoside-diphosphate-sugar epimerase
VLKTVKRLGAAAAEYLAGRFGRGFSLASLGPVEGRLLFDFGVAAVALASAALFTFWSDRKPVSPWLLSAPLLLVLCNAALGIYTRLKLASGRVKAGVLLGGVALVTAILAFSTGSATAPLLWALLTYGPLAAVRLVLAIPYSKHPSVRTLSVNRRGPVLVIGGAGYIGSHTVDLLLAAGHEVRVLDRLMYGRGSLAEFEHHPGFQLIEGDATEIPKLTAAVKGASAVVHLGGLVGDPACAVDTDFTRHANIVATRMAKDVAQSLGVHRFVFASSCSVYGVSEKEVSEQGPLNPVSLYAQTKIDSEKELLFSVPDEFFVTILRFATVFGHSRRPRFDLVGNLFTAQAMNDGLLTVIGADQWRPFIHVRDLARAIVMVLDAEPARVQSQVFNVGDSRLNMTILQLAEAVQRVTRKYRPVEISIRENIADRRNYAVSFQKIQRMLGFEASVMVDEGILEMAENFEKGIYRNYRDEIYSNLAMTRHAADSFHDPATAGKLYGPLTVALE